MSHGFVFEDLDLTVIFIPKSASCSMWLAVLEKDPQGHERLVHIDRIETSRSVAMWRHPTERSWSCYKFMKKYLTVSPYEEEESNPDCWAPGHHRSRYYPRTDFLWDEYLHALAKNRKNPRMWGPLVPQVEYCLAAPGLTMVPWDFPRMNEIVGIEIPHSNQGKDQSPVPDITPEMQYHLNLVYGADYRIWESIA
jgi:hypothetical protein